MIKVYEGAGTPEKVLRMLSDVLREGELVIIPTDTRYSLCCNALNQNSLERLAKLKGIDIKKSLFSILCSDISQVSEYARLDNDAFKLLKNNTPGPFTFILPVSSSLPKIYKWRKEVGVRIPRHSFVQELIEYFGHPLTGFSLPIDEVEREEEYGYHPELIEELWGAHVPYVVDGGVGSLQESAIIDCVSEPFQIIREGPESLVL